MDSRLSLLATVDKGVTESETLQLGLHQALAELSGLGGMVHLSVPVSALSLVSAAGLPPALTRSWETLDLQGNTAPARAVRTSRAVWGLADSPGELWPDTAFATVPIFSSGRVVGALSIVRNAQGEPSAEQWDFLKAVGAWAGERMGQALPLAQPLEEGRRGKQLDQALREAQVGSWDWNVRTGELTYDEAAMAISSVEAADFVPRIESWVQVVHPDDLPRTLAAARKAIRDRGVYDAEYRVLRPDGTYDWTHARGACVLDDEGEPVRLVGMWWDISASGSVRDALIRALRHMSDGFLSVTDDWRIAFVNLEGERILGSPEEELIGRVLWDLPAVRHMPGLKDRYQKAAAVSEPTGFDIRAHDTDRCYHLRVVPVPDGTTCYFTDVTEKRQRESESQAAERAAAERSARMTDLTAALAKAVTSRDVVAAVARRVLPPFGATGLLVQAVKGNRAHIVGSVGYSRSFLDQLEMLPISEQTPIAETLLSGTPLFISSPEEYAARYPKLADRPAEAGKQSWAFLPLTMSGRSYGVCVISFDHTRRLTAEDRILLDAVSSLVSQALDRARLYDAEHTRAQELQRGLLPRELPSLPACTAAARYLPAGQSMDVGGDWYDIIPLSAGRVALVIGDVMGHGLSEAATMGRLRTAVHTLADLELPLEEIFGHLNDVVVSLGEDSYATCLYALYDPATRVCSFARAGHPPPAVMHPDGTVYFPQLPPNPPLGVAEPPFETVELAVPDGSLLALFSDGLVESAARDIDHGMAQLAQLLQTASDTAEDTDQERLCDTLTAGLLPAGHRTDDDAALLVGRLHALDTDAVAVWPLPADPQAAGLARVHVREQLSAWDLDDLAMTTELLASELVGNVVRHAKGPARLRLLRTDCLICEVSDGSQTTPRIRRALETDEGGRGLQLVAALSQRWGTRYTTTGKVIWTEQPLNSFGVVTDGVTV
ncbi:SpoIIE family protein phosphatase [Streptomyces caeruleatus]|uniref:protein-serine/threonine phosphatase n=1 Tax=Streptomyces caeruleatus TaxID=661399 RepID=A0A101TNX6_9ACTN|nr:SpoIIE family protein phosphatase [Streptomyces caeruleatus]KUN95680.1 protein phosphatase [Streptomyces caeruleatus]